MAVFFGEVLDDVLAFVGQLGKVETRLGARDDSDVTGDPFIVWATKAELDSVDRLTEVDRHLGDRFANLYLCFVLGDRRLDLVMRECHARETGSSSESCDDCDDSDATRGAWHALIQPG